jgi:class 3 adenylate cyclase
VITAARIEQLNKNYDTQLLVSEDTFRHAPQHLAKQFRFLGPVQLKGRAQDIGLYAFGA